MKSISKSALALVLAVTMTLSSLPAFAAEENSVAAKNSGFAEALQSDADTANASPLIVTEVVSTGPTKSRFTYTEIYNNSDTTINFKDYHFYYRYPQGTGQDWTTGGKNIYIDSGKALVLWQSDGKASSGMGNSVADFNKYYGVNLVENKDIYKIDYSGIHATDKRGFLFGKDEDSIIAEAWCNEHAADLPTGNPDKWGIQYTYPGSGRMSEKSAISKATPGSVDPLQVPATRVHVLTSVTSPNVESVSAQLEIKDSGLDAQAKISYPEGTTAGAMQVNLFYRQKDSGMDYPAVYTKVPMSLDTDGHFTVTVDRSRFWGSDAEWYVKASYGPGFSAQSDKRVVSIEEPDNITVGKEAPLIVTEVSPNPNGGQYSYVEIYNRTDKKINLSYYKFFYYYDYPTKTAAQSGKIFTVDTPEAFIGSGKTMVLWLSSDGTTIDQFNAHYGTGLVENQNIVRIDYSGLHSTAPRWIRFGTTEDNAITVAAFNQSPDQLCNGNSLQYSYPRTDDGIAIAAKVDVSTPGTVESWQVPSEKIPFTGYTDYPADDGNPPTLKLSDGWSVPASINEGDELYVMYDVDYLYDVSAYTRYDAIARDQGKPMRPYLIGTTIRYQLDGTGPWYQINQKTQWRLGKFAVQIPSDVLFGHDSVTYNVQAYTLYGMNQTENKTIRINRLNQTDGVRLNVRDGDILSGTTTITANNGSANADTKILVDGKKQPIFPMLENGAYFSTQFSGIDNYFKDALTAAYNGNDRDVITIYSPWCELPTSRVVRIDNKYFTHEDGKYKLKLTLWAGDSGTPFDEIYSEVANENHDDYTVTGIELRLANGKNYLPTKIEPDNGKTNTDTSLTAVHTVGDSTGMVPHMDVYFEIPDTEVNAVGVAVDTTKLSDGSHTVTATSNGKTTTAIIKVDNTAPEINVGVENNSTQYKTFTLDPKITDSNPISQKAVTLDGRAVSTPASINPDTLLPGEHRIQIVATDEANNTTAKMVTFQTETADGRTLEPSQSSITSNSASLSVNVGSQKTNVDFLQGKSLTLDNRGISVQSSKNGDNGNFPYELFTVNAGNVSDDDVLAVTWNGKASNTDADHVTTLYVKNSSTHQWDKVGTENGGIIKASFGVKDHVANGKAVMLAQCGTYGTEPQISSDAAVSAAVGESNSDWDGTNVPKNYDFAFAWETDTQYYSESFPYHYDNMNKWIVDNRDKLGIRYVIYTGDIVDDVDMTSEWINADHSMKIFDDAGMPYGVLAGNHDVYAGAENYGNYWKYFGENRFKSKSHYGGSYDNNKGHYDLLTENGQDMIILYMSWDVYTNEIAWMNQVLAQYPNRKAIICLHRYTNVKESNNSLLDYTGELLQKEVVAKNKNVIAVLNGHYHGATIQTDSFDDDGDGTPDRTVYQICTDYQSDPEGGSEYIKFLYFNLKDNKILVNSYSPYRRDFNYFDTPRLSSYGAGTKALNMDIAELDVPFNTDAKTLLTNSLTADVRTSKTIGSQQGVTGKVCQNWQGLNPGTQYGWYARVTSAQGEVTYSPVNIFTTQTGGSSGGHDKNSESGSSNRTTASQNINPPGVTSTTNGNGSTTTAVALQPDTVPVVSGAQSNVRATVPTDIAVVVTSATSANPAEIRISAPTSSIVEQLKNDAVKTVDLTISVPPEIVNNINANVKILLNVEPAVLQTAKETEKDVTVEVVDSQTGNLEYSWTFSGSGLNNSAASVTNVNLALSVKPMTGNTAEAAVTAGNTSGGKAAGVILDFANSGLLPAPANVRIYVGNQAGCAPFSKLYLYYFNSSTKSFEQLAQSEYTVDALGFVTVTIAHCSEYVLLPKPAANAYPVKSDTLNAVGIKTGNTYTFAMTVSGKEVPVFAVGDGKNFMALTKRVGNKYYVTVKATGKVDKMTGIYSTFEKQKPVVMGYVAITK